MKVKFQGEDITLIGHQLNIGEKMPDFIVISNSLNPVSLKDTHGVRIFLTVPSIDTPVCDLEVRTFNERASELENITLYTISMDLPFAQSRWCAAHGIKNVITLSDYKNRLFGKNTGTYIEELGLLARAAFAVDSNGTVVYTEYVEEVTNNPNYDSILQAAKSTK
ncbi:redoxin family protein [Clostridiales bacterium oral taxon 876 str. F0540]|nr:redoxin family protein [Clostridiales bacterium oral taxon 876 str. F0540]